MVSSEKVGLITHFFPTLTGFFLYIYSGELFFATIFFLSLVTFIFIVSYLHAHRITLSKKYDKKITEDFRDKSTKEFAMSFPLPYRTLFGVFSVLLLILYIVTIYYCYLFLESNPLLFFTLIVAQVSVFVIYILMLTFTKKFLKIVYQK